MVTGVVLAGPIAWLTLANVVTAMRTLAALKLGVLACYTSVPGLIVGGSPSTG